MDQEVTFSLSYEQLTRVAEKNIRRAEQQGRALHQRIE